MMISPPHLPAAALLLQAALSLVVVVSAATNFSVDDQDPLFIYSGAWERNTLNLNITTGENMDKDGGHMLATSPQSSATITYTCAYLLKVQLYDNESSQPIPFPPFFFFFFLSIFFSTMKEMS